jgi:hypothetical protein
MKICHHAELAPFRTCPSPSHCRSEAFRSGHPSGSTSARRQPKRTGALETKIKEGKGNTDTRISRKVREIHTP